MRWLVFIPFLLTGCFRSQVAETGQATGSLNGQPIAVQWQRDSDGHTSMTVPPIVSAATSLLPPPWGELAQGALALVTGGGLVAAKIQANRAREHKEDADEGWALATKVRAPEVTA